MAEDNRPADIPTDDRADRHEGRSGLSRRSLLRGGLIAGASVVGGGLVGGPTERDDASAATDAVSESATEPFWGTHQSGIVTGTQKQTVLAGFDVRGTKADLAALMRTWTQLAAELTAGLSVTIPTYPAAGTDGGAYADATATSTTDDSLEAYGLGAQRLTITVGFGRSLFVKETTNDRGVRSSADRFGLAEHLPPALVDLPHFSGDELDAAQSGGDLYLQACADDPLVALHAIRSLARIAPDVATLQWTQPGFSAGSKTGTPRNLMGFKDGTINSDAHPPADLDTTVWASQDGPAWMAGGSYLVYRRIRVTLEHWDRLAPGEQEQVIGRYKLNGAPLGASDEFDPLDLDARDRAGQLVIPVNAHVRLAAPASNEGAVILRRAFSYNNGTTPFVERWPPWRQALEYDSGLLFLAYQRDPRDAFIPMFTRLSLADALNQFTTHTASGVWAIPPGAEGKGDWIGRALLE